MSNVQVEEARKRERGPLNGVDTPTLFATINAVKAQPELAKFQFRATNRWVKGTHSRSRIETFSGAGSEHRHTGEVEFNADHPAVLVGRRRGTDAGRIPAARHCRVHHVWHRQHRRGARRDADRGRVVRRRRHRSSRAFSACRTRSETATSGCGCTSASRATRRRKSSRRSSRSRRRVRRCSTC